MGFKNNKFTDEHIGKSSQQQINFYKELIRQILLQMNALEMKAVCFLCGHYPLFDWAADVVEKFNANCNETKACDLIVEGMVEKARSLIQQAK